MVREAYGQLCCLHLTPSSLAGACTTSTQQPCAAARQTPCVLHVFSVCTQCRVARRGQLGHISHMGRHCVLDTILLGWCPHNLDTAALHCGQMNALCSRLTWMHSAYVWHLHSVSDGKTLCTYARTGTAPLYVQWQWPSSSLRRASRGSVDMLVCWGPMCSRVRGSHSSSRILALLGLAIIYFRSHINCFMV